LLAEAERAPVGRAFGSGPWHHLWSALCHQDDVYTASYRALPELVRIARVSTGVARSDALLLAAAIEVCRHAPTAPPIPSELVQLVEQARLDALILVRQAAPLDSSVEARLLAIADAAFSGDIATAQALIDPDDSAHPTGPA